LLSQAAAFAPTAIADKTPKLVWTSTLAVLGVPDPAAIEAALSSAEPWVPRSSLALDEPTSPQPFKETAPRIVAQTKAVRSSFIVEPFVVERFTRRERTSRASAKVAKDA